MCKNILFGLIVLIFISCPLLKSKSRGTHGLPIGSQTKRCLDKYNEEPNYWPYYETYYDPVYTPNNYYSYAPYDSPSGFYYW